jgi:hypothetical protein
LRGAPGQRHSSSASRRTAGADRTELNPDFADQKLAKFWDYARCGVDIRKGEAGSREQLEQYGRVVGQVRDRRSAAEDNLGSSRGARKRVSPSTWANATREPEFKAVLKAINDHRCLTRAMKGACMALIA